MKTIVVLTDFSEGSSTAIKYAANMALKVKADLYLFHVMTLPSQNPRITVDEITMAERRLSALESLEKIKGEMEKLTENQLTIVSVLEQGSLEDQLENFCQRKAPFTVVMGIGKNKEESFLFGNNTLFAIQHLQYPVLVIPDHAHFHGIKRILLAYDLEDFNKSLPVEYLKEIKVSFNASFDLLHVNTKKNVEAKPSYELASVKALLNDLEPQFHFITADTVEEGINKYLEVNKIDLMVMLPKHHIFFSFHKSHTKQMALNAKIPLLAIHE